MKTGFFEIFISSRGARLPSSSHRSQISFCELRRPCPCRGGQPCARLPFSWRLKEKNSCWGGLSIYVIKRGRRRLKVINNFRRCQFLELSLLLVLFLLPFLSA